MTSDISFPFKFPIQAELLRCTKDGHVLFLRNLNSVRALFLLRFFLFICFVIDVFLASSNAALFKLVNSNVTRTDW